MGESREKVDRTKDEKSRIDWNSLTVALLALTVAIFIGLWEIWSSPSFTLDSIVLSKLVVTLSLFVMLLGILVVRLLSRKQ